MEKNDELGRVVPVEKWPEAVKVAWEYAKVMWDRYQDVPFALVYEGTAVVIDTLPKHVAEAFLRRHAAKTGEVCTVMTGYCVTPKGKAEMAKAMAHVGKMSTHPDAQEVAIVMYETVTRTLLGRASVTRAGKKEPVLGDLEVIEQGADQRTAGRFGGLFNKQRNQLQ